MRRQCRALPARTCKSSTQGSALHFARGIPTLRDASFVRFNAGFAPAPCSQDTDAQMRRFGRPQRGLPPCTPSRGIPTLQKRRSPARQRIGYSLHLGIPTLRASFARSPTQGIRPAPRGIPTLRCVVRPSLVPGGLVSGSRDADARKRGWSLAGSTVGGGFRRSWARRGTTQASP